ncbi:MAG: hypothetical protein H6791_00790 [Candidatus Nomurabacteria bacterium]|nr:MAG: hypothetical protein H6791_00790 [Candidatus Nomurabacteria bacterium]
MFEAQTTLKVCKYYDSIDMVEKFYRGVFNLKINIPVEDIPEVKGFCSFCYNTRKFSPKEILAFYEKKWGVKSSLPWRFDQIDEEKEQKRPKGPYGLLSVGNWFPDDIHIGRNYESPSEDILFANLTEYLLMTGIRKFQTGEFMDNDYMLTKTSSLFTNGYNVCARHSPLKGIEVKEKPPFSPGAGSGMREIKVI